MLTLVVILGIFFIFLLLALLIKYVPPQPRQPEDPVLQEGRTWLWAIYAKNSDKDLNTYQLGNLQFEYSNIWHCHYSEMFPVGHGLTPQEALQDICQRAQTKVSKSPKRDAALVEMLQVLDTATSKVTADRIQASNELKSPGARV
jgi:hypothetical protein